jgi:hypothetical protein
MFTLSARNERIAIVILTVLMAATRIEHFGINQMFPDASTAIFFLGGLLIGNSLWFLALLAEALALDITAINVVGVDPACISFGYCMMIPAYAALWFASRGLREDFEPSIQSYAKLALACVAGLVAFFVLSNFGYYYGAGFSISMPVSEYVSRVAKYFPYYLTITLAYSAFGVAVVSAATYFRSGRRVTAH